MELPFWSATVQFYSLTEDSGIMVVQPFLFGRHFGCISFASGDAEQFSSRIAEL